ncbi:MAG: hypothetical protein JWR16_3455 [Nevskia sp.]|nr:hypothetical protein [Nevskia sp.]
MISLEDALAIYAQTLHALPAETIAIADAAQRVLAQPLIAQTDLPRIDQSAMDGYALRAADVANASADAPLRLPIVQQIAAGAHETLTPLLAGSVARILTGAPVPPGADTVIPQERVLREGRELVFSEPYAADKNIRRRGEELRHGTTIAAAGQRITPGLLASLINAGITELRVHRRPRIRVLVTGDEVRPAGSTLAQGQIPDSNGPMVRAVLTCWGVLALSVEHVGDTIEAVRDALARGLAETDLVISAGGASVGDRDYIVAVAEQLGVQRVFWKVAQKPGKPMFFGVRETDQGQATLLALPGNPGAVLIGLALHVQRTLDLLEGIKHPAPHWAMGVLSESIDADAQRVRLVRMQLNHDASGVARLSPLPNQDSHMLSNLSAADVLVWVPAGDVALAAGAKVQWVSLPI